MRPRTYSDIFGKDNFFLEIQDQGLEQEHRIHSNLFRLEKDLGLPLVATNDSHYLCEDDAHAQDVMLCIQTGKSIQDTNRMKFQGTGFFVKSHDEMQRVFKDAPTCSPAPWHCGTLQHASWKKSAIRFRTSMCPPDSRSTATSSTSRAKDSRAGWKRCARSKPQGRLKHNLRGIRTASGARDLAIIQQMKFSGYFLIVWDFIRYARERDIPVGPGRGSAAGSLVSYALGITDLDPLQHELLFERFLNPERISLPDIDIDFCMNRRGEVINYVTQKYGRENVAQIITFGTMAAKAAIKDVGRAMDMPYADVDRIAKMVPDHAEHQAGRGDQGIAGAAAGLRERSAGARAARHRQEARRAWCATAGVHAAGVVISPRPLTNWSRCTRPRTTKSSPPSTWWRSKSWAC